MDRTRALAVLVAVFLLGCIVGTAGSYFWVKKSADAQTLSMRNGHRPPPGRRPNFKEVLKLTPEQERRFSEIITESRKQLDALRAEEAPRFDALRSEQAPKIEAILAETNRKLSAVLNEEQRKKFAGLVKERQKERERPPHDGRGLGPSQ